MSRGLSGAGAVRALPGLLGRRVSLRYRIADPAVTAPLTDAVGEVTDVDAETVVVLTRRGPVRVPTNAVTAVREIPPARPKRASLAAVTRLEALCAAGWPAVVDLPLGQWRLRAAGGFTGRANSCLAVGDPGRPLPDALAEVRSFAAAHGLPARVQVPEGSPWHSSILGQGWHPDDGHAAGWRVAVLVSGITKVALSDSSPILGVAKITFADRSRWRVAAVEASGRAFASAQEHVLTAPDLTDVGFALAHAAPGPDGAHSGPDGAHSGPDGAHSGPDGAHSGPDAAHSGRDAAHSGPGADPIGSVRLAVVDDHLYVTRLGVAEEHRRHGLATALMNGAYRWGAERGARWCVLQVAGHNDAALALYRRLGFTTHHHYVYLVPPRS